MRTISHMSLNMLLFHNKVLSRCGINCDASCASSAEEQFCNVRFPGCSLADADQTILQFAQSCALDHLCLRFNIINLVINSSSKNTIDTMENSVSADDSIEKADNRPVGVSGAASPSVAIHPSGRAAEDSADQAEKHQERSLTELSDINLRLNPQKSMQIHLEPPPVIKRPPKIKNDNFSLSFNYHTYSLFSWSRTEQKEVLHCARSTSHSYEFQTTLRLLGFNISKKLVFKTSESGIDTAVQQVRMVSFFYSTRSMSAFNICSYEN